MGCLTMHTQIVFHFAINTAVAFRCPTLADPAKKQQMREAGMAWAQQQTWESRADAMEEALASCCSTAAREGCKLQDQD